MLDFIRKIGKMDEENVKCLIRMIRNNRLLLDSAVELAKKSLPDFMGYAFELSTEDDRALRKILSPRLSAAFVDVAHDAIERRADMQFDIEGPESGSSDCDPTITLSFEITLALPPVPTPSDPNEPVPIDPQIKVRWGCRRT